ncbi:MAG: M28 family peptidase, partial [Bacteroidota bacterium]
NVEIADKIIRTSLTENKGYNWLKELCKIGPRLSGSEKSIKAIKWAQKKMLDSKFDSVWLQPVMVPNWVRGKVETAVIEKSQKYGKEKLTISALGGSIATPKAGITAEVIEVKSLEEAAKLGDKAKGKIVFYNRPFDNGLVSTLEGYGKAVDQRTNGAAAASKVGAVAVLVRSVQSGYDGSPHTGALSYRNTDIMIPGAAISVIDADFLSKAIKEEPNLKVNLKLDCSTLPDALSYNVIGEIKGNEKPDEVIVVGGHLDSWDKGCGAHDCGAPSIQTMEVLDLFIRLSIKPKRTIRCVLFINEENGLRGAIEYGKYASTAKEKHLAAIESDRGAFTPRGFSVTTDSATLEKIQKWLPILNKARIEWIRKGGSGADVRQIKNAKALFGYVPDDLRYMDFHHSS